MNNRYANRAKISESKFKEIVRYFAVDLNAIQISELTRLNRNTVNRYLNEIRQKIDKYCVSVSAFKRFNIPVEMTDNSKTFIVLIREHSHGIAADLFHINSNNSLTKEDWIKLYGNTGYDLMINLDSGSHFFLSTKDDPKTYRIRLNRLENFWSTAKSRLAKFKGLHPSTLRFHVRECEFRFNNRDKDINQLLLKILRNDPLF
jgi:transposase